MSKSVLQWFDQVAKRAGFCCEYCKLPQFASFFTFHLDHIRPLKHGGSNHLDNLAFSCPDCNFCKGTDIGSYIGQSEQFTRLYHPRRDHWHEHFTMNDGVIEPKTEIAEVTVSMLKFNQIDRLIFRKELIKLGVLPDT